MKPLYLLFAWFLAAIAGKAATEWLRRRMEKPGPLDPGS